MQLKTGNILKCAVKIFDVSAANRTVYGSKEDGPGFHPWSWNFLYFDAFKVFLDYYCSHTEHLIMILI